MAPPPLLEAQGDTAETHVITHVRHPSLFSREKKARRGKISNHRKTSFPSC